ncbi:MAG: class I SAM-dependent methyltransferase [Planctomycetaceae bacterium]
MSRLTEQAHDFLRPVLQAGDVAIDATAGNGHDTLFLAKLVGENGMVFAFDIQPDAIANTQQRLDAHRLQNVQLLLANHQRLSKLIPREHHGKVKAAMFNLGYLPGSEKRIVTQPESTVAAFSQTLDLLSADGRMTVIAYPGHAGGRAETTAVREFLDEFKDSDLVFEESVGNPDHDFSPVLFKIGKQ